MIKIPIFQKNRKSNSLTNQSGFTIIELLVATTVFSVVLLVVSSGIIQIGRQYFKGITSTRTQETTRAVVDEISRSAQFAGIDVSLPNYTDPSPLDYLCLGNTRYVFMLNKQIKGGNLHALWMEPKTGVCDLGPDAYDFTKANPKKDNPSSEGKELLGENMRLLQLDVAPGTGTNTVSIKAKVAYGDNDLLSNYDNNGVYINGSVDANALCKSGISGGSFCSVSGLEIIVDKR